MTHVDSFDTTWLFDVETSCQYGMWIASFTDRRRCILEGEIEKRGLASGSRDPQIDPFTREPVHDLVIRR